MADTCCTTSNCAQADACARHEDREGKYRLSRPSAEFSAKLVRRPDSTTSCPFSIDTHDAQQTAH